MKPTKAAILALILTGGVAACDSDPVAVGPMPPGAISVTIVTSGFLQDDSYDLLVDGQSVGVIGANGHMTIPELDPATYEVALGDMADNCTLDGSTSAEVSPADTAAVSLSVVCAPAVPASYTVRANRDRPNLDDGTVVQCSFGLCPSDADWDVYAYFNTSGTTKAVIRQNQTTSLQIAHVVGKTLAELTEADLAGATFTTDLVADPFDSGRVILVRTQTGAVYALGNPLEDSILLTLTFDAALIATP